MYLRVIMIITVCTDPAWLPCRPDVHNGVVQCRTWQMYDGVPIPYSIGRMGMLRPVGTVPQQCIIEYY